jgi:hypothetical protein
LLYLRRPPGGEKEKQVVAGNSLLSRMHKMAAVPAPSECPTHTCQMLEYYLKGLSHEMDFAFDDMYG